ncbi:uncharacterized protein B0I36DRAFT_327052 [Microdochium trichocladiopsis]|uniref:Uncharacterized protein n=1 Tax=Microdochium trichocladiopsis TaxID=1682393 RepID=A0A9P8Y3U1_9PEZI|nr:uncharacterized protein B0I36DRAFT_327052 [Microdochium trichocladiopsis]KAH7027417.1 hypothetical protein B0I36DRAFT_327052 [Microdochium trichocladiopsis]
MLCGRTKSAFEPAYGCLSLPTGCVVRACVRKIIQCGSVVSVHLNSTSISVGYTFHTHTHIHTYTVPHTPNPGLKTSITLWLCTMTHCFKSHNPRVMSSDIMIHRYGRLRSRHRVPLFVAMVSRTVSDRNTALIHGAKRPICILYDPGKQTFKHVPRSLQSLSSYWKLSAFL